MKIGIFDSGLGGLIVTSSLVRELPQYDYCYLGDTARVPYGNRSAAIVYEFTRSAVEWLFQRDCGLVIIACNTASADALARLQRDWLPTNWPDRQLLGVLIPTAETAAEATKNQHIGVLATVGTVQARTFERELLAIKPDLHVYQAAAPLLVPLVEHAGDKWAWPIIRDYLAPLIAQKVDTVVLGCTHYPYFKTMIREQVGDEVQVISQDELMPAKLADFLTQQAQLASQLAALARREFYVTDITPAGQRLAEQLFAGALSLELVQL